MKTSIKVCLLSLVIAYGAADLLGCTYEAPQTAETVGAGGNDATSSSGQGGSSGQSSGGAGGQGGGVAGAGGGGPCTPGTVMSCTPYSGPPETQNKGVCTASISSCSQSGSWLGCTPEVLPTLETCADQSDVNCDEFAPCSGTLKQSNPFVEAQTSKGDLIFALAVGNGPKGKDGPIYAVGARDVSSLKPLDLAQVLVWQRDGDGVMTDWSDHFAFDPKLDPNGAVATGVAVVPGSGDVIVTGIFVGGILSIDGTALANVTSPTAFFVRFSASGTILSKRMINMGGLMNLRALTIDPVGNIFVGGSYDGTPVVDSVPFPSTVGPKGFVMRMDTDGHTIWAQTFSGSGSHEVAKIVALDNNNIITATEFVGPLSYVLAGNTLDTVLGGPDADILVNRLRTTDGRSQWKSHIIGTGISPALKVGGLAATNKLVAIGGTFRGTVKLGDQTFAMLDGMDTADGYLATINSDNGAFVSKTAIQSVGVQSVEAVAFDSVSDIIIGGSFSSSFALDGVSLNSTLGIDAFVAKTDPTFKARWAKNFGDMAEQMVFGLVVGKNAGHIYAGGTFDGTLTGTDPTLVTTGGFDAFLIQMSN